MLLFADFKTVLTRPRKSKNIFEHGNCGNSRMAGSGREMETDGFQVVSLSPRRLRERKRACRGLGMADDSPSPSPNPTPLPSPFEPVRDDQVARAPRAVGVPQGTSRVPLASARRLHACCGWHVSVHPSRLHRLRLRWPCRGCRRGHRRTLTVTRLGCADCSFQRRPLGRPIQPKVHAARHRRGRPDEHACKHGRGGRCGGEQSHGAGCCRPRHRHACRCAIGAGHCR